MSWARMTMRWSQPSYLVQWLAELDQLGLRPVVHTIGIIHPRDAHAVEYGWIRRLRRFGYQLVNTTGFQTSHSETIRQQQQAERSEEIVRERIAKYGKRMRNRDTTPGPKGPRAPKETAG